jgi:hypothetical protein
MTFDGKRVKCVENKDHLTEDGYLLMVMAGN